MNHDATHCADYKKYKCPKNCYRAMLTEDVAPAVHGRWIRPHWKNSDYCCYCSQCGGEAMHRDYQWDKNGIYAVCPICGAMMDGAE